MLIPWGCLANSEKKRGKCQVYPGFTDRCSSSVSLWSHYRILWHGHLNRVHFTRKETSDPKLLGSGDQFLAPHVPRLYCQQLPIKQKSISGAFCEILQRLPRRDARAKLFQTLDVSHVPTHVKVFCQPISEAYVEDLLSLVIKTSTLAFADFLLHFIPAIPP